MTNNNINVFASRIANGILYIFSSANRLRRVRVANAMDGMEYSDEMAKRIVNSGLADTILNVFKTIVKPIVDKQYQGLEKKSLSDEEIKESIDDEIKKYESYIEKENGTISSFVEHYDKANKEVDEISEEIGKVQNAMFKADKLGEKLEQDENKLHDLNEELEDLNKKITDLEVREDEWTNQERNTHDALVKQEDNTYNATDRLEKEIAYYKKLLEDKNLSTRLEKLINQREEREEEARKWDRKLKSVNDRIENLKAMIEELRRGGVAGRKGQIQKAFNEFKSKVDEKDNDGNIIKSNEPTTINEINDKLIKNIGMLFHGDEERVQQIDAIMAIKLKQWAQDWLKDIEDADFRPFMTSVENSELGAIFNGKKPFYSFDSFLNFIVKKIGNATRNIIKKNDTVDFSTLLDTGEQGDSDITGTNDSADVAEVMSGESQDSSMWQDPSSMTERELDKELSKPEFVADYKEALKNSAGGLLNLGDRYVFDKLMDYKFSNQIIDNLAKKNDFEIPDKLFNEIWNGITNGTVVDEKNGLLLPGSNPLAKSFVYTRGDESKLGHVFKKETFKTYLPSAVIKRIQNVFSDILLKAVRSLENKYPGLEEAFENKESLDEVWKKYREDTKKRSHGEYTYKDKLENDRKYREKERGISRIKKDREQGLDVDYSSPDAMILPSEMRKQRQKKTSSMNVCSELNRIAKILEEIGI